MPQAGEPTRRRRWFVVDVSAAAYLEAEQRLDESLGLVDPPVPVELEPDEDQVDGATGSDRTWADFLLSFGGFQVTELEWQQALDEWSVEAHMGWFPMPPARPFSLELSDAYYLVDRVRVRHHSGGQAYLMWAGDVRHPWKVNRWYVGGIDPSASPRRQLAALLPGLDLIATVKRQKGGRPRERWIPLEDLQAALKDVARELQINPGRGRFNKDRVVLELGLRGIVIGKTTLEDRMADKKDLNIPWFDFRSGRWPEPEAGEVES